MVRSVFYSNGSPALKVELPRTLKQVMHTSVLLLGVASHPGRSNAASERKQQREAEHGRHSPPSLLPQRLLSGPGGQVSESRAPFPIDFL